MMANRACSNVDIWFPHRSLFLVAFPLTMITSQYTLVANRYAESREKAREARRDRNRLRKVNSTLSILSNVSTGQASIVGTVRSKFRDWKDVVSKNSARSDGDLNLRRIRTAPVTNGRDNSFRDNSFNRDERPKESSTLNRKTRDVSRSEAGSRVDGEPNRTPFDPGISFGTLNRSRSTLVHSASVPNLTNESIGDTFRYPMHRSFGIGGSSGSFRSPANRPASHETIEIIPSPQGSGSTSSNLAQIELVGPSSILGATTNPLPKTLRINVRDQRHLDSILRYIDSL
ncbi:uncharacterized protein EV422DRAFT_245904 [Fimicolochytrium jonesii]|uniref:uncharacterized protein n=1 Tax=Fimicolochytrium jonesii TaxID=1396493 RepID=UPI0022FF22AB|nr:uncharacterized protein EV422DRAFT_245904 [Fimicolochytrium jonesii]KAI8825110.1 hypothetical protein EV422DRAFT_245904 [Fimicolochytrium jonesii]